MAKLLWHQCLTPPLWLAIYCAIASIVSFIGAADFWTWLFELWVGFVAVILLVVTYKRFPFSNLVYWIVAVHFTVFAIAAHYTYAGFPLFNWLKDTFHLSRNHFDRVGHFLQGFTPALLAREMLLRRTQLKSSRLVGFLCFSIAGAITAIWEILEAYTVIFFYKTAGPEWLGWQGDIWDAQNDMLACLVGATIAMVLFAKLHDRSMQKAIKKERAIW